MTAMVISITLYLPVTLKFLFCQYMQPQHYRSMELKLFLLIRSIKHKKHTYVEKGQWCLWESVELHCWCTYTIFVIASMFASCIGNKEVKICGMTYTFGTADIRG